MKNVKLSKKNVKVINKKEIQEKNIDFEIIKKVAMKALKVVATNGDKKALDILIYFKNYKTDDFEDLIQAVALASMESGYKMNSKIIIKNHVFNLKKKINGFNFIGKVSKKNIYRVVRKEIYRMSKEELHTMSYNNFIDEKKEYIETVSYNQFLCNNNSYTMEKKAKFNIESLGLTERQAEIIKMYASLKSINKVAEILGISKQAISKTINIIRNKVNA